MLSGAEQTASTPDECTKFVLENRRFLRGNGGVICAVVRLGRKLLGFCAALTVGAFCRYSTRAAGAGCGAASCAFLVRICHFYHVFRCNQDVNLNA